MLKHSRFALVVLLSGNGSNLQAIIDAITNKQLDARIATVITNNPQAHGLVRAEQAGIAAHVLKPKDFADRNTYDAALLALIEQHRPNLVILAGFMRILGPDIVKHFHGRMLNIHPALLPNYRGLNTHARVLAAEEKKHGTSVHFVTDELDGGPIIARAQLNILPTDNAERLKQRVQALEHKLYPTVIGWIASQRLQFSDTGVLLDKKLLPSTGYDFADRV